MEKTRKSKTSKINALFPLLLTLTLMGCGASDAPYKETAKPESQITTKQLTNLSSQKFIYNHAITKIPTFVNNTILYDSRDRGAVRINLVEDGIEVRMLPNDLYTHKNKADINEWPLVIKIPGQYIDYKCSEDSYEHCLNREQVNNDADVSWDQKRYFLPNFAGVVHFNNDDDSAFGSTECLQQMGNPTLVTAKNWKGSEIDLAQGVINFELEKRYKLKETESCLIQFKSSTSAGDMHQNSFSTNEFYSLVSSKLLQSGKYEPVSYSRDDYAHFGFFDSAIKQQDYVTLRDINNNANGARQYHNYLNRWDPKRENITYYLSNNYYLPENKPFLDAAKHMVKAINVELKEAKTGMPIIKLVKQEDKHFGDLRYSFIALFNPADNFNYSGLTSLITDTQSGEIVNAYIVMNLPMLSNSKSGVYANIQETFKILNEKEQPALAKELTIGEDVPAPAPPPPYMESEDGAASLKNQSGELFSAVKLKNNLFGLEVFNANEHPRTTALGTSPTPLILTPNLPSYKPTPGKLPDYLKQFWKTNLSPFYGPNSDFWNDSDFWVSEPKRSAMIAFSDLPKDKQIAISELLSTPFYSAILVHELGHSFGLRHNFKGSTDHQHAFDKTSNFYKAVQPKINDAINKYGEKSLQMLSQYSSVMDYMPYSPGSYFNRIYGAYDLAALRFAYAREVETESNQAFDLNGNWQDLKHYDYMTIAGWKKESPSADVFGRGAIEYAHNNAGLIMRYGYCSDSEIQNDFYCNKSDAVSNNEAAHMAMSRGLVDAFYFNFYGMSDKNGLFDMSELGKSFATGDYYDSTSSLIKIRQNIARLAKTQGITDLDDFLNSNSCQSPIDFKSGLNNCMTLRFNLNQTLNMMVALMDINDLDARVVISLGNGVPQLPGMPLLITPSNRILSKDINLSDIYKAAINQHLSFDLNKEAYSNDNSYLQLMSDEQHKHLYKQVLVLNNPIIIKKIKSKFNLASLSESDLVVSVTPSRRSSVITPLNGITRPGNMMVNDALAYKNSPAQWPGKLELMQELLRTNDLDHTDHFANVSMVDLDHHSGRFLEIFLCNSVMHTDYSPEHLSTTQKPMAYPLTIPPESNLRNNCYLDVLTHSDIFNEELISSGRAYAPYTQTSYDNVVGPNLRYNFQNDWGNDPANKFIEPVVKSHSNMQLFDHFGLPYRQASQERTTLRINYLKALLRQVVIGTQDAVDGDYDGHGEDWREYVSVHKVDARQAGVPIYEYNSGNDQFAVNSQWVNSASVYDFETGKSIFIGTKNILANKLRTRMAQTATKIWHLKNDLVSVLGSQLQPKPQGVTIVAPQAVKKRTFAEYQKEAENLLLQLKRDKNVLFNLLPQLD